MTPEEPGISTYFLLFFDLFSDAPGFKDNPREKEILEFSTSLDKIFEDLEDALGTLNVVYDLLDQRTFVVLDEERVVDLKAFIITYTLDNMDIRVHAYRERVYHLTNLVFGMDYPMERKQENRHPEVEKRGYHGAIEWWLEGQGKLAVREALKAFSKMPLARSLGRRTQFVHRLPSRISAGRGLELLDDQARYVATLDAALAREAADSDDVEALVQEIGGYISMLERERKIGELFTRVKAEVDSVLDALKVFAATFRTAMYRTIVRQVDL